MPVWGDTAGEYNIRFPMIATLTPVIAKHATALATTCVIKHVTIPVIKLVVINAERITRFRVTFNCNVSTAEFRWRIFPRGV